MRFVFLCLVGVGTQLPLAVRSQEAPVEAPAPVTEEVPETPSSPLIDALKSGQLHFNLRLRAEFADAEGFQASQAYTSRLRLGYSTARYLGLLLHADFEDIRTPDESLYNSGVNREPGRTIVADPPDTDLNQIYADFEIEKAKTKLRGGRQRIIFDDARFIGNVGWRQNEQTFEGGLIENQWVENLTLRYAYISEAHRIFGDDSSVSNPSSARDFNSDSHLVNVSYDVSEWLHLVGFAYLLDLKGGNNVTGASNSSDTYGLRATGCVLDDESLRLLYTLSYAHQVENSANPGNYNTHYVFAEAKAVLDQVATVENVGFFAGYELLGSDNGRNQFRTPLSTAHKFNGWADAFLDNGGPQGLQDFYLGTSASLPWELSGKIIYHKFNKADGGGDLGWEFDALLTRPIVEHVNALAKYAYFEGREDPDTWRLTIDLEVAF